MHKGGIPILGYALKFMAFVNYVLVISSSVLHGKNYYNNVFSLVFQMPHEDKEQEEEQKARTAYDLIRMRLERLQKNIVCLFGFSFSL